MTEEEKKDRMKEKNHMSGMTIGETQEQEKTVYKCVKLFHLKMNSLTSIFASGVVIE